MDNETLALMNRRRCVKGENGDPYRDIHMVSELSYSTWTILHEIGYELGLGHSGNPSAVMHTLYQDKEIISLSADDKITLHYLYGAPSPRTIITTTICCMIC